MPRENLQKYLKEYRRYLWKIRKEADAHKSGYSEISGAIQAVNYLLSETRKGKIL